MENLRQYLKNPTLEVLENAGESDSDHDHGKYWLSNHLSEQSNLEHKAQNKSKNKCEQERHCIREIKIYAKNKAHISSKHQELALSEIENFCRFVNDDKSERDERIDTAYNESTHY